MAELLLESADRDAHVRLVAEADPESLPVIGLTVRGEFVDLSVIGSNRSSEVSERTGAGRRSGA